jgi:hypothetical protein
MAVFMHEFIQDKKAAPGVGRGDARDGGLPCATEKATMSDKFGVSQRGFAGAIVEVVQNA